jgi:DNA-binding XRE family transcriptional regulator
MNYRKLAELREQSGFTQEEMANSLGYKDKSSYCLIENGKVKLTLEKAKLIKEKLNLSNIEFIAIFFNENVEVSQTNQLV